MPRVLEDLLKEDARCMFDEFDESQKKIKKKVDEVLYNFDMFVSTGNMSFLAKELTRSGFNTENMSIFLNKKTNCNRVVLDDITAVSDDMKNIKIKTEKLSTLPANPISSLSSTESTIDLNNEMPAPKQLPIRKRKIKTEPTDVPKRPTRSRKQPERYVDATLNKNVKYSDVIIHNATVTTIDITDSVDKQDLINEQEVSNKVVSQVEPGDLPRPKRTRTIRKNKDVIQKHLPGKNEDEIESVAGVASNEEQGSSGHVPSTKLDATYITNEKIKSSTTNQEIEQSNIKEIETKITSPPRQKNAKEVFSPFSKTSTKQKVHAFEKLKENSNICTPNVRLNKMELGHTSSQSTFTPKTSNYIPSVSSTSKANRYHITDLSDKSNIPKSHSALKASQAEFQKREKQRQEKENEVLKKKEALLLAMSEEKRKKREESQLKAQQQRERIEKEKLKIREEKYKREREEQIRQQKMEVEQLLVKKQAKEIKKLDHRQLLDSKSQQNLPEYLVSQAPLLPTEDCYDSDECEKLAKSKPSWSRDRELKMMQIVMQTIGERIKNTFFSCQIHSPDLQEIFQRIDPQKLKRTSSAIWRKPPRYTIFEESRSVYFSEDDE